MYLDSCSKHFVNDEAELYLSRISSVLKMLSSSSIHLIQPADSFIIQKIKDEWQIRWKECKYEFIRSIIWTKGSGKIRNLGKRFFKVGSCFLNDENQQKDRMVFSRIEKL